MYGETTVIRGLARGLREQGIDIRAEADSLVGHAEAVPWTGLAADAMRSLARVHAGDLRVCATRHDDAADALDRHAREVDHLVELIASIEHRVLGLLDSARGAVGGLTHALSHVVPGVLDHWAHQFVPPPHDSLEWLDVHVPGIVVTTVRVDLDLAVRAGSEDSRLHVGYALRGARVAAVVAAGTAPIQLRAFDVARLQAELEACLVVPVPDDVPLAPSRTLELPWDLLVGTGEALVRSRPDLYDELVARGGGAVRADGVVLDPPGTHEQLRRVHHGVLARVRVVCSGNGSGRHRIGWNSWLLFGDGWRELTPYVGRLPGRDHRAMVRLEPRRPADLATQVARWAVAVRS